LASERSWVFTASGHLPCRLPAIQGGHYRVLTVMSTSSVLPGAAGRGDVAQLANDTRSG
jgi:hypothetical protein